MSNWSPMPAPRAMISGRMFSLDRTRSRRAFSTFSSLPRSGRDARGRRFPPPLAGPGARGGERRLDYPATVGWVLFEVLDDPVGHRCLHRALDVGVAELRLRLTLELRVGELDADHRGQPFPNVLARQVGVLFREDAGLARPVVERAGQGGTEPGDVRPTIHRVNVVR